MKTGDKEKNEGPNAGMFLFWGWACIVGMWVAWFSENWTAWMLATAGYVTAFAGFWTAHKKAERDA